MVPPRPHWNEASVSENENSSETSEQNETTCRYAHCEIQNFTKIRITLLQKGNSALLVNRNPEDDTPDATVDGRE